MPIRLHSLELAGMVEYPRTKEELGRLFPSEAACVDFIAQVRWPRGFECPHCGYQGPAGTNVRGQRPCRGCGRQVSVLAGTIFEGTRTPLHCWFEIAWDLASKQSKGTAGALRSHAGIGTHKTAWLIAHKLRRCLGMPTDELLGGRVEVDDYLVSGIHPAMKLGGASTEHRVLIAVELASAVDPYRGTPRLGRCRIRHVEFVNADVVREFILSSVAKGSEVITDRSDIFTEVMAAWAEELRSEVRYTWSSFGLGRGAAQLPNVQRIGVDAERWLQETFQGAIRSNHADFYLDEWAFRFNHRSSSTSALPFRDLLLAALRTPPVTRAAVMRSFPARLIPMVLHHLADHGCHATVTGGWAVDGLLRRETRIHSDLDLLIPGRQLESARHILAELAPRDDSESLAKVPGWSRVIEQPGPQLTLERPTDGTRIDLHPMDPVGHQGWREIVPASLDIMLAEALPTAPLGNRKAPALAKRRRPQSRPVTRKYPVRRRPLPLPQQKLEFTYHPAELRGIGMYGNASCDTLTEDAQRRRRAGYPLRDEDRHDLLMLAQLSQSRVISPST